MKRNTKVEDVVVAKVEVEDVETTMIEEVVRNERILSNSKDHVVMTIKNRRRRGKNKMRTPTFTNSTMLPVHNMIGRLRLTRIQKYPP